MAKDNFIKQYMVQSVRKRSTGFQMYLMIPIGFIINNDLFLFSFKRSRHEYLKVLVRDLMTYYSYNEYFMEYLVDLFPGGEVQ